MIYTFENAYFPCTKDKFNVIVWKYFQSTSITFFLFSQKQKVLFIMLNIITHNKTSFSSNFELTFIQNGWHNRQQQKKILSPGKLNVTLKCFCDCCILRHLRLCKFFDLFDFANFQLDWNVQITFFGLVCSFLLRFYWTKELNERAIPVKSNNNRFFHNLY